tara:strand:+ start:1416 stop:2195 length:780 start_codon:yes stop_codon:yes gene_type:complete
MNSPLVSIIINCFNGEKYLSKCIKSILNQDYQNFEIIFWDNLSSDNSKEIIKSFVDNRIKYFSSKKFLNLYEARNEAIQKTNGKYITFLDTDDFWSKDKLKKQVDFLRINKNYKIVYSNSYTINEKNKKKYLTFKHLPYGNITKKLLKSYTIGILTVCIDKSIFKDYKFDKRLNILGDFDFFINLSKTFEIGCIQEPLAFYRVHEQNYSTIKIKTYIDELKNWIDENKITLNKEGYSVNKQRYELLKLKIKFFLNNLGV